MVGEGARGAWRYPEGSVERYVMGLRWGIPWAHHGIDEPGVVGVGSLFSGTAHWLWI